MLEVALAILIIGLTLFKWRQNELARMIPLVAVTSLIGIVLLLTGKSFFFMNDMAAIAMLGVSLWLGASLLWTDSHLSAWEFQAWIAYLFIAYLSRYADPFILLPVIMITGTAFAIMSLGFMVKFKYRGKLLFDPWLEKFWFLFGNPVHTAALEIIPLFISVWAGINLSPIWFIATALMLAHILIPHPVSNSRGAIIGIIVGAVFVLFALKLYFVIGLLIIVSAITIYYFRNNFTLRSVLVRIIYYKASYEMLKVNPMFGYGLNMFRKIYPEFNPALFANERIRKLINEAGGVELATGHRPHNDLVDIAVELGLMGLAFFCLMFLFIPWGLIDPVFIGAFIAYAVGSMFFFPLREVHTAIGFWVFTGILMGFGDGVFIHIHPLIAMVVILLLCRIIYGASVKLAGLYFFDLTQRENGGDNPKKNIRMALGCDPYCARYLMFAFLFHVETEPELAFEYAQRQLMHFDGGKVKWGVYDQFARAVLRIAGINMAEMYVKKALHINPEYPRSRELLGFIHKNKEMMAEQIKKQQMTEEMMKE